jgi:hypothetical protein
LIALISKQKSNGDVLFNIVNLIAGGLPNFATNAAPSAPNLIHLCLLSLLSIYVSKRYTVT